MAAVMARASNEKSITGTVTVTSWVAAPGPLLVKSTHVANTYGRYPESEGDRERVAVTFTGEPARVTVLNGEKEQMKLKPEHDRVTGPAYPAAGVSVI